MRCRNTDKFPPRAQPLRVATFCSSGHTWVGFLHGLTIPVSGRPLLASRNCILSFGGKHATRCSPSRLLTNRVALIFIFFSDASRHPASYEIGSGENSSTYYVTLRERLLDKIIDARRKFTICYTDVPYYKGSTSCRNHREVNLGIGIPL